MSENKSYCANGYVADDAPKPPTLKKKVSKKIGLKKKAKKKGD